MKIALVHDQLQEFGGAERVLYALKKIYPQADVYTSFYNQKQLGIFGKETAHWKIITSWADKFWLTKRFYSPLRFITPLIWEPFNFGGYDVVLSSSGTMMCKGIITKPSTVHICYLHHPPRYLYYYETAREWQKYWLIRVYGHLINHKLRLWDYLSSQRVDYFIVNSQETQKRVTKFYHRDSHVIYCPVDIPPKLTQNIDFKDKKYYVTTSRLARAKHVDVLIKAANQLGIHLKIVGSGRDADYLKSLAGPTVQFMGSLTDAQRDNLYHHAKAYLFSSVDEEFGIAPVEAMGYGLPVIAFASGGLKETVQHGENGYLFPELSVTSLAIAIQKLEKLNEDEYTLMSKNARTSSEQYTFAKFKEQITRFVDSKLQSYA